MLNTSSTVLHRFATLATRMEQYIQGQSRDLVDQAYTKFVSDLIKSVSSFMIPFDFADNSSTYF